VPLHSATMCTCEITRQPGHACDCASCHAWVDGSHSSACKCVEADVHRVLMSAEPRTHFGAGPDPHPANARV